MRKHLVLMAAVLVASLFVTAPPCLAHAEGNAGTATDVIYYDKDTDIDMHFAPLDNEAKTVKLAYAHLKETSAATPENQIDFVIPSAVEVNGVNYTVTAVGYDAKYATTENSDSGGGNTDLLDDAQTKDGVYDRDCFKSVIIPETVNTLGSSCFGTWGIKEVLFTGNPTVSTFGYGIFRGCKNLKSVDIPSSVTDISGTMIGPFCNSGLTSVFIPKTVKTISSDSAFANCPDLAEVTFEDGSQIAELASGTFSQSNALKTIRFGSNSKLTALPAGKNVSTAFFGNKTALETVDFGEGNSIEIGNCAFWGCTALKSILHPDSVSVVRSSSFRGCSSLEAVQFENTTCIEKSAFRECSSLKSVAVGSKCSSFGDSCFLSCSALSEVRIGFSGDKFTFGNTVFQLTGQTASGSCKVYFLGSVDAIEDGNSFGSTNSTFLFKDVNVYARSSSVKAFFEKEQQSFPIATGTGECVVVTYHQLPSFADSDVAVSEIAPVEYTGEALTPDITVIVGTGEAAKTLKEGEDFQLVYSNNTEIGTADVEIQGIGETYAYDSRKVTFEIVEPAAVTDAKAKIAAVGEVTSLDQKAAVEAARAAYDAITNEAQKALIGDEQVDALKAAETQVKILGLEKQIADANDASVVGSLANQLAAAQAELDTVQTELGKTKADAEAAAAAAKADLDAAQAKISSAKADQKLTVAKAQKAKTVKAKKKAVKTSKVKVSGAKTKLTYAKVSGSEKLSISTSGKIKVKKGTKKGTYKIKVLVVAKSSAKYNAAITTVTIKVKVK